MSQPKSNVPTVLLIGDAQDPLFREFQSQAQVPGHQISSLDWPENTAPPANLVEFAVSRRMAKGVVIIHRRNIGPTELSVISELRSAMEESGRNRPKLELILGDLVRYAEVQTLSALADRITPESVASDLLPGRLARFSGKAGKATVNQQFSKVGILSSNLAIAEMLAEWVQWCGYTPLIANGWSDRLLQPNSLIIWDVPTLSDRWLSQLRIQARRRPVLTLLAMSNRDTTEQAKLAGAVACLDLPFEADDLSDLLAIHVPEMIAGDVAQDLDSSRVSSVRLRSGKTILRAETGHDLNQDRAPWSARSDHQKSIAEKQSQVKN